MINTTVSHYRIVEKLGHGGTGIVYKAVNTRLHRFVALKFLPESVGHDPQALARFRREAQTASALNHPNICALYEIGEQAGQAFFATEFLDGVILKYFIAAKPLETETTLGLAVEIADALAAAHAKGAIHRDITPANIFVNKRGQAKVLEFGLTRVIGKDVSTLGAAGYMSPEQVCGKELDARTDLFSLGAVLFEMCTGTPPFVGAKAISDLSPVAATCLNPNLPAELDRILTRALEKDRNLRYQSAAEMRADLQRLKHNRESIHRAASLDETTAFGLPVFNAKTKSSE